MVMMMVGEKILKLSSSKEAKIDFTLLEASINYKYAISTLTMDKK
jgi:hypothetical protein